jgi:nicotinate phosphoribosyltransferase
MWLLKDSPALLTDMYELTMAQVYYKKQLNEEAHFDVFIRRLPENWGFFVMAGLAELKSYLEAYRFSEEDIEFLRSLQPYSGQATKKFSDDFLEFLKNLKPDVRIRSLPEGTVFFAGEPILEIAGPLIHGQILESYILNILGFSIIEASLATRLSLAAGGIPIVDFGLRRSHGPIASVRAARAGLFAGFSATSNLFASRLLDFTPSGTMAHSFVEVHQSEQQAFLNFAEFYGEQAILVVDTYKPMAGIKTAAAVAEELFKQKGVKIRGVRIDSGGLVSLTKFARKHFKKKGVEFLKIFVSGGLDEFAVEKLLAKGAQIDGFGIGTRFATSHYAPDLDIAYKLAEYNGKPVSKRSPEKETYPGRKTVLRVKKDYYEKDIVLPFNSSPEDLLKPFKSTERVEVINKRLTIELSRLSEDIKRITKPAGYKVEFSY